MKDYQKVLLVIGISVTVSFVATKGNEFVTVYIANRLLQVNLTTPIQLTGNLTQTYYQNITNITYAGGNISEDIWNVIDNGTFQYDIGSDCSAGECVYGVNTDGSLDCRACSGGGAGVSMWVDGGTYIYPNTTYADNVWIRNGSLNVTESLRVYSFALFYENASIEGDLIVSGNTTLANLTVTDYLSVGRDTDITGSLNVGTDATISGNLNVDVDANVSQNLDIGKDLSINGTINSSKSKSYFYFDENGTLVVHLE